MKLSFTRGSTAHSFLLTVCDMKIVSDVMRHAPLHLMEESTRKCDDLETEKQGQPRNYWRGEFGLVHCADLLFVVRKR